MDEVVLSFGIGSMVKLVVLEVDVVVDDVDWEVVKVTESVEEDVVLEVVDTEDSVA